MIFMIGSVARAARCKVFAYFAKRRLARVFFVNGTFTGIHSVVAVLVT